MSAVQKEISAIDIAAAAAAANLQRRISIRQQSNAAIPRSQTVLPGSNFQRDASFVSTTSSKNGRLRSNTFTKLGHETIEWLFSYYDSNGDGEITKGEFFAFLYQLGKVHLTRDDMETCYDAISQRKLPELTLDEFYNGIPVLFENHFFATELAPFVPDSNYLLPKVETIETSKFVPAGESAVPAKKLTRDLSIHHATNQAPVAQAIDSKKQVSVNEIERGIPAHSKTSSSPVDAPSNQRYQLAETQNNTVNSKSTSAMPLAAASTPLSRANDVNVSKSGSMAQSNGSTESFQSAKSDASTVSEVTPMPSTDRLRSAEGKQSNTASQNGLISTESLAKTVSEEILKSSSSQILDSSESSSHVPKAGRRSRPSSSEPAKSDYEKRQKSRSEAEERLATILAQKRP